MKKILTTILMALASLSLYANNNNAVSIGFESEYIFRGVEQADNVATISASTNIKGAYVGIFGYHNVDGENKSFDGEIDFYGGYEFEDVIVDGVTVDVGGTVYYYPEASTSQGQTDYSIEPYVGASLSDLFLTPAVYAYYDINKESITIEASISEDFVATNDLPLFGALTISPSAKIGYADINDINPRGASLQDSYKYTNISLDSSVSLNNFTISAGIRYDWTEDAIAKVDDFTWGTSVSYNF